MIIHVFLETPVTPGIYFSAYFKINDNSLIKNDRLSILSSQKT